MLYLVCAWVLIEVLLNEVCPISPAQSIKMTWIRIGIGVIIWISLGVILLKMFPFQEHPNHFLGSEVTFVPHNVLTDGFMGVFVIVMRACCLKIGWERFSGYMRYHWMYWTIGGAVLFNLFFFVPYVAVGLLWELGVPLYGCFTFAANPSSGTCGGGLAWSLPPELIVAFVAAFALLGAGFGFFLKESLRDGCGIWHKLTRTFFVC